MKFELEVFFLNADLLVINSLYTYFPGNNKIIITVALSSIHCICAFEVTFVWESHNIKKLRRNP